MSQISFSFGAKGDIKLIKGVICARANISDADLCPLGRRVARYRRRLDGQIELKLHDFPPQGLRIHVRTFYAGMDKGRQVSTKKLVQRLLPGVDLPELTFTTIEIKGDVPGGKQKGEDAGEDQQEV